MFKMTKSISHKSCPSYKIDVLYKEGNENSDFSNVYSVLELMYGLNAVIIEST